MWHSFFDKVFLINLPSRRDRYATSTQELTKLSIPHEVVPGIAQSDGREGLYLTMRTIFQKALTVGMRRILVFEDDVHFLQDPGPTMERSLRQLPSDWDLLYLGCNLAQRPTSFFSPNLITVTRALSTHAVGYSSNCMATMLTYPKVLPVDLALVSLIQNRRRSFCVCPFLATQLPGYSDIEKRPTNWTDVLEKRFYENVSPLLNATNETEKCCRA